MGISWIRTGNRNWPQRQTILPWPKLDISLVRLPVQSHVLGCQKESLFFCYFLSSKWTSLLGAYDSGPAWVWKGSPGPTTHLSPVSHLFVTKATWNSTLSSVVKYFHIWKLVYSECQWHYRRRTIFLNIVYLKYILKLVFCSSFSRLNLQKKKIVLLALGCEVKQSSRWAHYSRHSTLHLCLTAFSLSIVAIWKEASPVNCFPPPL